MLYYCDTCGKVRNLPIQHDKTVKAPCGICQRYIGPVNFSNIDFQPETEEEFQIGKFKIKELEGFPVDPTKIDFIDPSPHKIISEDMIMFYRKGGGVILANPKTGKKIEITT
jgi:hypothetical protein